MLILETFKLDTRLRKVNPKARRTHTAVLIPAKDEALTIGQVVSTLKAQGFTVVCIDDGSLDNTFDLATKAGAIGLRHLINRGQGAAIRTGIRFIITNLSEIKFLITFDADGQHDVNDAINIEEKLSKGEANLILGSRFLQVETKAKVPKIKRSILGIFITIRSLNKKFKLTDLHNGIRGMSMEIASLLEIKEDGYAHADEITKMIYHPRTVYCEIPVSIVYTDYSRRKGQPLSNGLVMLVDKLWK